VSIEAPAAATPPCLSAGNGSRRDAVKGVYDECVTVISGALKREECHGWYHAAIDGGAMNCLGCPPAAGRDVITRFLTPLPLSG